MDRLLLLGFGSASRELLSGKMEYALSMQDPFLSAGLEAEKTRKLNLTVADCGLACRNLKEKGSEGEGGILIEDSPWDWDFKGFCPEE